jgi:hypothetical protein
MMESPYSGPVALRRALRAGHQVRSWEVHGLIGELDRQREQIEAVISGENRQIAAEWLLAMVKGCRAKLPEVDDFDCVFAMWWVEDLVVACIRARMAAGVAPLEIVHALLRQLEPQEGVHDEWVDALDAAGCRALERELVVRLQGADAYLRDRHLRTIDRIRRRTERRSGR